MFVIVNIMHCSYLTVTISHVNHADSFYTGIEKCNVDNCEYFLCNYSYTSLSCFLHMMF